MARCLANDNQIHCQNNANSSNLFRMKNHLLAKSHQAYAVMRVHVHVAENCPSLWNPRHPCSDLRPLRCMDAAGKGKDHRGEPEGADQERHQLRASVPGKLKIFCKT